MHWILKNRHFFANGASSLVRNELQFDESNQKLDKNLNGFSPLSFTFNQFYDVKALTGNM